MQIKIQELKEICLQILIKKGLSEDEALQIFNEFLDGELRGRECHGFASFAKIIFKLEVPKEEVEVLKEEDNLIYLDGKKNLGQLVCNKFVPKLIEKAKSKNLAMMGIKNMKTYLMPGTYARMIAEQNLIGIISNYGGSPRVVPTSSIDPLLGSNTLAIGIPGKNLPIVSDYATGITNMGKVRLAEKLGQEVKPPTYLDKDGQETINPAEVIGILPFGEHKGYALALFTEVISKTIFNIDEGRGFFFLAINPSVFQNIDQFKENVSKLTKEIKNSRKAEGVDEIFFPGERSEKTKQENLKKDYLDLDEKIINDIKALL